MERKKQLFKGLGVLSLSQILGQLCSLCRNIIVARGVSPADFGVAAIFMMVIAFLGMISNLSLDRLLIQAKDGNDTIFQDVAQFLQACRGIIICLVLLMSAGLFADLFSVPEAKDSFLVLAFIPLISGFCHLDPKRIEREMRFWPGASVELTSQIIVLLIAWPVVQWYGDYRAMLALLIVKVVIMFVGSQFVAERPYRWSLNKMYIKRFATFGWPLLINGLLLFGILQGDRFIMGAAQKMLGSDITMVDVGYYSAAFTLTMVPAMMLSKISSVLFLPMLSRHRDNRDIFFKLSEDFGDSLTILASSFVVVVVLVGDVVLPLVYGEQYVVAGGFVGWLGVMWSIRVMRGIPASIAMAHGQTTNLMKTNIIRIMSLVGVFLVIFLGMDVVWVAIMALIGEGGAYIGALYLNKKHLAVPYGVYWKSIIVLLSYVVISVTLKGFFPPVAVGFSCFFYGIIILGYLLSMVFIYWSKIQRLIFR